MSWSPPSSSQRDIPASGRRVWVRRSRSLATRPLGATDCARLLGPEHPDTLTVRTNLAASYRQAGRTAEAITIEEQVVADSRLLDS